MGAIYMAMNNLLYPILCGSIFQRLNSSKHADYFESNWLFT